MNPGDLISERYELRERVARGGMGEVWRAFDLRLERLVAIKTGIPDPGGPSLLAEGRAAAMLDHPNIVAVHDAGTHDGEPFIVMEYVPGPSLREELREHGALPEREALAIGDGILAALAYAHGRGVWHNDVKPENILIGEDGAARLTDFGVASVNATTVDLDSSAPRFATVAYTAPEVLAGSPQGTAADLYAAAMTIYECVARSLPNRTPAPAGGQPAVIPPLRESAPNASEALESVLARALEPDPANRYTSATTLRTALDSAARGAHHTVPLAAASAAGAGGGRQSWRALALGTIGAGILALGAGALFLAASGNGNGNGDSHENPLAGLPGATQEPADTATPEPTPVAVAGEPFTLYLHNNPDEPGDSGIQGLMPMSPQPGPAVDLPNYSTGEDDHPGRTIDEDDEGLAQDDAGKYASWQGEPPYDVDFSEGYQATVMLWFAEEDWDGGNDARFEAWLRTATANGGYTELCHGATDVTSPGGNGNWSRVTISFGCQHPAVVTTGDALELKVTLTEHSESGDADDMMLAYGTEAYDASLLLERGIQDPPTPTPEPTPMPEPTPDYGPGIELPGDDGSPGQGNGPPGEDGQDSNGDPRGPIWERAWDGLADTADWIWESLFP